MGAGGTSAHGVGGTRASQPVSPGLPSQKPKEQQRSVLRPAVLQAPQPKALSQTGKSQPRGQTHTGGCDHCPSAEAPKSRVPPWACSSGLEE